MPDNFSEQSTVNTKLYYDSSSTSTPSWVKLIDITTYPSFLPPAERLDVSDLSHRRHLHTEGMLEDEDMTFGYNYKQADYAAVLALEDGSTRKYKIEFGDGGEYGAWTWQGTHHISIDGGDVGGVRTGTITMFLTSDITPVS